jgi:hypothetical protein
MWRECKIRANENYRQHSIKTATGRPQSAEKKRPTREITRREARAGQAKSELFRKPIVLNIGTLIVL